MIKEKLGYPVGCCPTTTSSTWKGLRETWGDRGFDAVDVAAHTLAALLWSDFIFFGPTVWAPKTLPAVAVAEVFKGVLMSYENKKLPENSKHPLNLLFGDFAREFAEVLAKKSEAK